jgi:choline dehydrogenase
MSQIRGADAAVKGIDGLRVVDASIMPGVPSVALNPTTIMIAERLAKKVYAAELTEAAERPQVIRR